MLLLLSGLPVGVALAHLDPKGAGSKVGEYRLVASGFDIGFDADGAIRVPRGFVYGHLTITLEGHTPRASHYVFGPVRFSPADRGNDLLGDAVALSGISFAHRDCTPPETMRVLVSSALLRSKRKVPADLRAPGGAPLAADDADLVDDLIARGRALPTTTGLGDTEDDGADVFGETARRFTVKLVTRAQYVVSRQPCAAPDGGGTGDDGTGDGGTGDGGGGATPPAAPTSVQVQDTGYEHPSTQTDPRYYSAVCGDIVWDPPVAGVAGSAVLEVLEPDGTWRQEGEAQTFTTDASGRIEVRFGINVANRTYRIGAVVGTVSADSAGIDVGAGSPPRQTRDCYPP